jgi:hypothetical protein
VRLSTGESQALTVIACQFRTSVGIGSSLSNVDWGTEGNRARARRHQQALVLANYLQSLQGPAADPARGIIVAGDLAAFEFNDGYGDPVGVLRGVPAPDLETATSGDGIDVVTPDFTNLTPEVAAAERYQGLDGGVAQATQHLLVSRSLLLNTVLHRLEYARACADFAETARNTAGSATRATDTDPMVAFFTKGPSLGVGPAGSTAFGVRAVQPNPASGPIRVRFAIEAGSPARLELFDLGGRRVEQHLIERAGAGEQSLMLAGGRALRPGVYQLRLTQGERRDSRRVLVVR